VTSSTLVDTAVEVLAQRLYEVQEKLDPSLSDMPSWHDLREHDRNFYRATVRDLARYPDLWLACSGGKHDPLG